MPRQMPSAAVMPRAEGAGCRCHLALCSLFCATQYFASSILCLSLFMESFVKLTGPFPGSSVVFLVFRLIAGTSIDCPRLLGRFPGSSFDCRHLNRLPGPSVVFLPPRSFSCPSFKCLAISVNCLPLGHLPITRAITQHSVACLTLGQLPSTRSYAWHSVNYTSTLIPALGRLPGRTGNYTARQWHRKMTCVGN